MGEAELENGGEQEGECSCGRAVVEGQEAVQCDWCNGWFHRECAGVAMSDFEVMGKAKCVKWFCLTCDREMIGMRGQVENLRKENEILRQENAKLMGMLERLEIKVDDLKDTLKAEIKAEIKEEIRGEIGNEFQEDIRDQEEKRKRERNIIISNLKEGEEEREDMAKCRELFSQVVEREVKIERVVRIGGKVAGGNPRLALVTVGDVAAKWNIIRNNKKLSKCSREEYQKVYINPDLTQRERVQDKKLRDELRARRGRGEEGWFIKRGELCRRNFTGERRERRGYNS